MTAKRNRSIPHSRTRVHHANETAEDYVEAVEQAARDLVAKRLLLEDDVSVYVEMARQRDIN